MQKATTLLLAGVFMAGTAVAGETMGYEEIDANGDGLISAAEAQSSQALSSSWERADANADGVVDQAEFSALETAEPAAQPGVITE